MFIHLKKLLIPPVFLVTSVILIVLCHFFWEQYNLIPHPFNIIGTVLQLAGLVLIGKTGDLFKKYNTTLFYNKSTHLIEEGLFKWSRNPMYVGIFLLVLGFTIIFRNVVSLVVPILFFLVIRYYSIPIEEKMMEETFGEKYLAYKARTRVFI